ncbi:hypothetical protein [Cohnella luojiensis]|uniref:Hsp20/alpha crystallin family protein n=1 Tax=Cohnella luojiensis TaxID=652876 RepID=A0A4Y8M5E5_9BACL|nr:hypothetical protein [Cohnella luojiensis]TFE29866.1 hypothetical protein E2980_03630 [Cohnella luojiensis]
MGNFFDSGPLPDWKDIQKLLGKEIPWKLAENWDRAGDSDWLNQYVKKMMQNSKSVASVQSYNLVQMETKQEAKSVSVTIRLGSEIDIRRLQLFATSDRLKLTGLPGDKKRTIRFPCLVYARTGQAAMKKDGLLVVRFKRRPPEKSEYELFIRS